MSRTFTVDVTTSLIARLLIFSFLVFPNLAQGQKPIFTQDLEPFGFQTEPVSKIIDWPDPSSLTFLSDDLVLVSVNEPKKHEMLSSPTASHLATLLLFSLGENKLIRQTQKQMALHDGPIQATRDSHFLFPDGTGVQLCSAEFRCSDDLPIPGQVFVSPRGTKAIISDAKSHRQELIDTATLSVLKVFVPDDPFVLPGDEGLLMLKDGKVWVVLSGQKDHELGIAERFEENWYLSPDVRFLSDHAVIGFTNFTNSNLSRSPRAVVTALDGKVLASIPLGGNPAATLDFAASASGSRFCMHEAGEAGLNVLGHLLDDQHLHNFVRVQVFEVQSGRRLFNLEWNPEPSGRTVGIRPALSPSGRRLALIRKGVLQVYEIP